MGTELLKEYIGVQSWIDDVPWLWLSAVCFAFWLGYDLYHKDGRLRDIWRLAWALGEFGELSLRNEEFDPGPDLGGARVYKILSVPFSFHKSTDSVIVRVAVTAYRFNGMLNEPPHGEHVWRPYQWKRYMKGDRIDIDLACLPPERDHPGFCGDREPEGLYFGQGYGQMIKITVSSGRRTQERSFLTIFPQDNEWGNGPHFSLGSRMIVFNEQPEMNFDSLILAEEDQWHFSAQRGYYKGR